jgi:hypothetical protein
VEGCSLLRSPCSSRNRSRCKRPRIEKREDPSPYRPIITKRPMRGLVRDRTRCLPLPPNRPPV